MILYHGSSLIIEKPDIFIGRWDVDFGQGFYLTSNKEQAVRWANRRKLQNKNAKAVLNIYNYNSENSLSIKQFDGYDEDWLEFVIKNRTSKSTPVEINFDIVFGCVADDDVIVAIDRYIELLQKGHATNNTKLALLDELKFSKPNDQFCFKTKQSLLYLSFVESKEL
ncbi:MAG: DUF3990 domain-containing protein [Bacteroidales bacterium]|jgi:hypothetical protein|nr:DUF3990 domain-containing protein [Bacteroidales bacterium]